MSVAIWAEAFVRHNEVLQAHLQLLSSVRSHKGFAEPVKSLIEECWNDTQRIIGNSQRLRKSIEESTDKAGAREPSARKTHKKNGALSMNEDRSRKRARIEQDLPLRSSSHEDVNGFFTIDTNPTAVEELLSTSKSSGNKSKQNAKQNLEKPAPSLSDSNNAALSNNAKSSDGEDAEELQHKTAGAHAAPPSRFQAYNDEFDAKVALKQAEKAAKRQQKLDRKRKRESATSLEDHARADAWPTKKQRQKGRPLEKDGNSSNGNKNSKASIGGPNKKRPAGISYAQGGRNKKKKKV